MIILDLDQVMISNMMAQIGGRRVELSEDLLRHMVLNSIRAMRSKFLREYGPEFVIANDDRNYWRRNVFPYYKAQRKQWRDQSNLDWKAIFEAINVIRDELREVFPYKFIQVDGAEADDIIGTLCKEYSGPDPILIISGDKDFQQLQKYDNVSQYDPVRKRFLKCDDPHTFCIEHIMQGDKSDGVPNVLSEDDCFINGRQKPLRKKLIGEICSLPRSSEGKVIDIDLWSDFTPEQVRNFARNATLIDLDNTPEYVSINIIQEYEKEPNDRSGLFNFFIEKKLKGLMDHIGEF